MGYSQTAVGPAACRECHLEGQNIVHVGHQTGSANAERERDRGAEVRGLHRLRSARIVATTGVLDWICPRAQPVLGREHGWI